jgi:hypothetical protein
MHPRVSITDVVFFSAEDDEYNHIGVAREVSETHVVVHEYSTNQKLRSRWRPIWTDGSEFRVRKICPDSWNQALMEVKLTDIMMVGKISGEVFEDNTKRRLLAKGFYWALPVGTPGSAENEFQGD